MPSLLRTIKRVPRWIWSALFFTLIAIFLLAYLRTIDTDKLRKLQINWVMLGIGTVVELGFLYLGAFIWRVILRALGATKLPHYHTTTDVYARAWMGRYIPGTVTWIAGKVYMASTWGISKSRLAVASLLEGGSQVLAITFVSFIVLGFDPRLRVLSVAARLSLVGLGLLVLIVLIPRVFNGFIRFAYTFVKRREAPSELHINGPAVVRSFSFYCIGGVLSGAASFFVIKSIDPTLALHNITFVIGAFGLAGVAGMAAPFAPSGLGIRDGLQLALLTAILPKETALAATILIRLWSVAVDFIFLGLTRSAIFNKLLPHLKP